MNTQYLWSGAAPIWQVGRAINLDDYRLTHRHRTIRIIYDSLYSFKRLIPD